jgi:nitronate monooxygenase
MKKTAKFPNRTLRQGGMGVYISTPFLANAVSRLGGYGTVSGVAPERILATILQRGDLGGHYRRALSHFPFPKISKLVLDEFYVEGGRKAGSPIRHAPVFSINPSRLLIALTICANYAFVWLAKEGHEKPVGINYLEKISMPHIYSIVGAMLAGVDFITMGAGIPLAIPDVLRAVLAGNVASYKIPVIGEKIKFHSMTFDPVDFFEGDLPSMKLPDFIPIISSNLLASIFMTKLPKGSVQGFCIEEPTAGGHNAPPRTRLTRDDGTVSLCYGEKDAVDYRKISQHGLPFWIGGSYASVEKIELALSLGASGVQIGTIFALSRESGMDESLRRRIISLAFEDKLRIITDMRASPTGFPFKVVDLDGTLSEEKVYKDGTIGYRCPASPPDDFLNKGGSESEAVGRNCICNGLISTASLSDTDEPPIVTLGDDFSFIKSLITNSNGSYSVRDVFEYLNC